MTATAPSDSRKKNLRFVLHYLEMVLAMFVGMFALAPIWTLAWPGHADRPVVDALVMAANMTLGMALWMRIRRHRWGLIVEMSAAMVLPFLALLVPYAMGALDAHGLMMGGHIIMLPAMLVAMLVRHREYRH
jgi:hypothetical protein